MKIEISATGSNVELLVAEYMGGASMSAVMNRIADAAMLAASASPRIGKPIHEAAARWASRMAAQFRAHEDAAFDYSKRGADQDVAFDNCLARLIDQLHA